MAALAELTERASLLAWPVRAVRVGPLQALGSIPSKPPKMQMWRSSIVPFRITSPRPETAPLQERLQAGTASPVRAVPTAWAVDYTLLRAPLPIALSSTTQSRAATAARAALLHDHWGT